MNTKVNFAAEMPDPFARLPALAERLGVKPVGENHPASIVLITKGGVRFDLYDLVNAALDRLAPSPKEPPPVLDSPAFPDSAGLGDGAAVK